MKRLKKILLIILLLVPLVGCQNQKNEWKETYQLTYFYLKDCSNCQHFKKNVLPAIKKEFGKHMKIKAYDMDDEQTFDEMKESYQNHIDQIIDFNEDDYGYGPMVFLEGYMAILGAGNEDDYVEHLVRAAKMERLLEDGINSIGLGPQGMGGKYSVMGVNIENTARHPSAIGVAVNVGCWSHRRGHIIFDKDLNYTITTHSEVTL